MIPWIATVRISKPGKLGFPLWIPLFLLWLLLLPLVLVLVPVAAVACLAGRLNPFRVFWGLCGVLDGLRGMRVEAGNRRRSVLIWIA